MNSLFLKLFNPIPHIKIVVKNHFLLGQLVRRNLESRYKGSLLGTVWSFVQPLMMLSIYTFVFTFVLKSKFGIPLEEEKSGAFAIIMFCGMAVFNIFSESVLSCSTIIISNQNLVKKVIFPLELLPIAQVISTLTFGLVWFLLLFIGVVVILHNLSWTMLLLPVMIIPLLLISCGCGFFVASLGVYLRDLPYMIGVFLQMLFFMTPIFYPVKALPEKYRLILYLNPLTEIIEQTRIIFLYGQRPNWRYIAILWVGALLLYHFGYLWFRKTKKGFADVL